MNGPRTLLTKLAMVLMVAFVVAMLVVLRLVGQDLRRVEAAHRETSAALAGLEGAAKEARAELREAREQQARLAEQAETAAKAIEALRGDLTLLQARVKAIESTLPQAGLPPGQDTHQAELPAALRDNPPPLVQAARQAFQEKGIAGFCEALGLDAEAQARLKKAHEGFLPQVRAAEKAHAKVAIEGDAVVIAIEPDPQEGHVLLAAWLDLLGQALTPAQQEAYAQAHGCYVLFERPFGHYTESIRLTRDANGVKFAHSGTRVGGAPTFEKEGIVTGKGAVDRLPWRHLLPDEAVAKLGGPRNVLPPIVDLKPGQTYKGKEGGLYPGGSNVRPAAHDAAGRKIARAIVPLDAEGNPDPVNGKIVLIPVSVSNAFGAWHRGDEKDTSTTFMTRANANPAKNPKLFIAYGFEYQLPGGNRGTGDPGPNSIFYRTLDHALGQQGLTPKQVQIVWLSMPVSGRSWGINLPPEHRTFPADAQQSRLAWKEIVHAIYTRYPNVKIIYSSTKGAMYLTVHDNIGWGDWNGGPIEPWNHDAAWGVKWVIEDQINGAPDLNYDPARGPVKAPWLSWGPYYWTYPDGTPRHYDGFMWTRADVAVDGLHPSLSGLTKYANMLLHQMTTDPTATPWFLRPGAPTNQPPTLAKAASVAANPVAGATTALRVLGADDGGEPSLTYTWSCSGPAAVTFSVNGPNKAKNTTATFPSAGRYTLQVTIADVGGLTATSSITATVTRR